jgi:hypothetical protein
MIERIAFKGGAADPRSLHREPEVLDVRLDRSVINVPLTPNRHAIYDRASGETREEYGYRLRRAAAEAALFLEQGIIAELRRMGHLV